MILFCQCFELFHDAFGNLAILCFRAASYTDYTGDFSVYKQRITASHKGYTCIIGLDAHQGSPFGSYLFGLALCDCGRVCLTWHERDTQYLRVSITAVDAGQPVAVSNCKTDVYA